MTSKYEASISNTKKDKFGEATFVFETLKKGRPGPTSVYMDKIQPVLTVNKSIFVIRLLS